MQITVIQNDTFESIKYELDNAYHREGGPAYQEWDVDGNLRCEIWYRYGKLYRKNKPAYLHWNNGILVEEYWAKGNGMHRIDGPASRKWNYMTATYTELYYVRGEQLSGEEIEKLRRPTTHHSALRVLPIPIRDAIWQDYIAFFCAKIYLKHTLHEYTK